jgi:hypothetical protein
MATGRDWRLVDRTGRLKNESKIARGFQLASIDGDGTTGLSASWITRPSVEIW